MTNNNDQILIEKYLQGDEKSLEILILFYLKPIYSFVYRYVRNGQDAEDITQEVFVRVWRNLKRFDQNKSFKTWIFSIAKNASLDFLKKKKAIPFSEFDTEEGGNFLIDTLADPSPLPHELLEKAGMAQILTSAMNVLSPKYRMVLFLRYNDHFNFREIAESLGKSLNTVKSRHRRALSVLKNFLLNRRPLHIFAAIIILASFLIINGTAQASVQQTDDSGVSFSPAPFWQQTLGNDLDFAVKDLEIRVKNSGDTFYGGALIGYLTPDYASDYPIGYGIPPIELYSFYNFGSSTPSGFDGKVALTVSSFPLNPNRYYKFLINGGDASRTFQVYGSASDTYSNGKAYYSSTYSLYPCASPLLNPEEACDLGANNGIADIFFQFGTADTLLGKESAVTTDTTRQGGAVIDGDLIAWMDNAGSGSPGDIYVYEISTGRKIRVMNDSTVKNTLMLADRKILWTTRTNNNDYDRATLIYDLDTATTTEITEKIGTRITISDFDGRRIVLQTGDSSSVSSVYLYDLATSQLTLIDSDDPDKQQDGVSNPKISGDKILYKWFWNCGMWCGQEELRLYDIATGEKTKILNNYGFSSDYAIDGDNIIVVSYSQAPQTPQIYRHKISTSEMTLIPSSFRQITGIDISGNIVVWSDNYDIFMYDLATGKTGRAGMASKESFRPQISGNTMVWDDYRAVTNESANIDIYMYRLASQNNPPTLSYSQDPGYIDDGINPDEGYHDTNFAFKVVYADLDNDPPSDIRTVVVDGALSDLPAEEISNDAMILDFSASPGLRDGNYANGEQYMLAKSFPAGTYRYRFQASDGTMGTIFDGMAGGKAQQFVVIENQPPIANFAFSPLNPKAGEQITFDASSSSDPGGTIVRYGWDWDGNGIIDVYTNTPSASYLWTFAGAYKVGLHVFDDKNATASTSQTITIEESPTSIYSANICTAFLQVFGLKCGNSVTEDERLMDEIDAWIRDQDGNGKPDDGSKPYDWLRGTRCSGAGFRGIQKHCLASALNKEMREGAEITYKDYIIAVVREQQLVHKALLDGVKIDYSLAVMFDLLPGIPSIFLNDFTADGIEHAIDNTLIAKGFANTVGLAKFGSTGLSLIFKAISLNTITNKIGDDVYRRALYEYFYSRNLNDDPLIAWASVCTPCRQSAREELEKYGFSGAMLEESKIKFEDWWQKYYVNLQSKYGKTETGEWNWFNGSGLPSKFNQDLKKDIKALILFVVKNK